MRIETVADQQRIFTWKTGSPVEVQPTLSYLSKPAFSQKTALGQKEGIVAGHE